LMRGWHSSNKAAEEAKEDMVIGEDAESRAMEVEEELTQEEEQAMT
jgi:hypothetical protein